MEPPVLHTPRLIVRAFVEEDIEDIYLASQDPDIQRWTTIPVPFRREHAENLVREIYPRGWAMNTHRILGCGQPRTRDTRLSAGILSMHPGVQ